MGAWGGVVEKKPDSTGNGALAEMAKVCTNVKCLFSCSWGRGRSAQKGRRVPKSTATRVAETPRSRKRVPTTPPEKDARKETSDENKNQSGAKTAWTSEAASPILDEGKAVEVALRMRR